MNSEFVRLVWESPTQGPKETLLPIDKANAIKNQMPATVNPIILPVDNTAGIT